MRVLVVPKWYPWPELPVFGLFCREHAAALATRHDVVVLATPVHARPARLPRVQAHRRGRGRAARAARALPPAAAAAAGAGVPAGRHGRGRAPAAPRGLAPGRGPRARVLRRPARAGRRAAVAGAGGRDRALHGLRPRADHRQRTAAGAVRVRAGRRGGPGQPRAGGHAARGRAEGRTSWWCRTPWTPARSSRPRTASDGHAPAERGRAGGEEGPPLPARGPGRAPRGDAGHRRRRRAARRPRGPRRASSAWTTA